MRPVFTFLVLLVLLSAIPDALLIATHGAVGLYVSFFMWTPGLASLVTCRIHRVNTRDPGWGWRTVRHKAYGYVLPLLYITPVYVTTWLSVRGSFNLSSFATHGAEVVGFAAWPRLATVGIYIPLLVTISILSRFPNTVGEELGWRAFLLPQIADRYGFTAGCLVTGIIWAVWHYPLLFAFGFFSRPNAAFHVACFSVMVIGLSFVIGWLRFTTDSIWPCVLLHASHNGFLQSIFDPLTARVGIVPYLTTEFGAGLMLTVGIIAFFLAAPKVRAKGGVSQ